MKKISLIITSLVFCIAAVFVFPAKEAQANPLAVGGALYLGGAGVYVVGAVAVAGLAGLAGCVSCQEDIEAHAARTWDGSTQLVKDGVQLMVDASVGAWGATSSALTATDAGFNTWMDSKIDSLVSMINGSFSSDLITNADWQIVKPNASTITFRTYTTVKPETGFRYINGLGVSMAAATIGSGSSDFQVAQRSFTYAATGLSKAKVDAEIAKIVDQASFMAIASYLGDIGNHLTHTSFDTATAKNNMTEAWEDMKDAGLVLPVDIARPMAGNVPLTYNPSTDTYAGIDGITVPHDDVTGFEFPKPNWKTLEDLTALGLSGLGAGLYIDGWPSAETTTSTYDPVTDMTTTVTSTGTTTSVTTGATSMTGTTTTTTTGDTTGNPPVDPPPVTPPKTGEPLNPFKAKPMPIAALTGLFQLLAALIFYLIRMFTFIATLALIAPTPIDNPYFIWFTTATFQGITPYPLVQNLALFFLGFSVYRSVRRVFG